MGIWCRQAVCVQWWSTHARTTISPKMMNVLTVAEFHFFRSDKNRSSCDLKGRKINFINSETLVWLFSVATDRHAGVTRDLPECKEPFFTEKNEKKRKQKKKNMEGNASQKDENMNKLKNQKNKKHFSGKNMKKKENEKQAKNEKIKKRGKTIKKNQK